MPGQAAGTSSFGPGGLVQPSVKDPLQSDLTAYEILGIGRNATSSDIQNAFKAKLASKGNVTKLTAAKRLLENPLDRALLDLFHYMPDWTSRLSPNPSTATSVLELKWRAQTASAWEQQLRSGFPDIAAAHSLALLWYWWGMWDEEHTNGAAVNPGEGLNAIDQKWRKAIACWSMVLSSDDFWLKSGVNRDSAPQVGSAITDKLQTRLRELAQKHKHNASESLAACYLDLEVAFTTELRTSRLMAKVGLRTKSGKLACGPLMIDQAGLTDMVRETIEATISKSPTNEDLRRLQDSMPPYGTVFTLLENNRPQAAIDALSGLPVKSREDVQGKRLLGRAYYALGRQHAGLNNFDAAMNAWETALNGRPEADIKEKILAEIVSACKSRVASLQHTQSDAAIALLERALRLTSDRDLKLLLAELLTTRVIQTINDAQRLAGPGGTQNIDRVTAAVRRGIADLERADALGSKRASEQLLIARNMLEDITSGPILRDAHAAAEREDWTTAIRCLRTALASASKASAEIIRKNLAVCLANRAMEIANATLQNPSPSITTSLKSAESDLSEAVELDPSNEHARQNLSDLHAILLRLQTGGVLRPVESNSPRGAPQPRTRVQSRSSVWRGLAGAITQTWWMWIIYFLSVANDSATGAYRLWNWVFFIGLFIWSARCFNLARRQ
jgi:tetratricopeptide (TPR) repeat protein